MGLLATFKNFLETQESLKKLNEMPLPEKEIVFYAESKGDWIYFEQIVGELVGTHNKKIVYLTSEKEDPIFEKHHQSITPLYIGDGTTRTILFQTINCKLFVMTLTDLGKYNLKRSQNDVHYVYLFHSMVSTHMTLRYKAIDAYDTILTIGPHHEKEIRKHEEVEGLSAKTLIPLGYNRLDKLIEETKSLTVDPSKNDPYKVLIAPSWGENSITRLCSEELIDQVLKGGFEVVFRPHPMSFKTSPKILADLDKKFSVHERFTFEKSIVGSGSLHESNVMICDWSGVALEYAFSLGRPVIFIDVPKKVHNPHYEKLEIEPFEVGIREEIGAILSPEKLSDVSNEINKLCASPEAFKENQFKLRDQWIYNVGKSGQVGAQSIVGLL